MGVADAHIWRTTDGRHVPHEHPDAAFLAYPTGAETPDEVLDEVTGKPAGKARRQPANKATQPAGDKAPDAAGGDPS